MTVRCYYTWLVLPFAVQIYPCDSNPCQNGATCDNDPSDISKYQYQCQKWFAGENCEGNLIYEARMQNGHKTSQLY